MNKSMNFSFKKAEDSPGFLLWQLTNQWQQQQRKALHALGLTHPQFVALAGILWLTNVNEKGMSSASKKGMSSVNEKGMSQIQVSQIQVAEFTHIDKMMMSDLVKTLLQKNLIERHKQIDDKRAYSLTLTRKGHALTLKAIPVVEGIDAQFFKKETQGLTKLVAILNKRLT